MFFLIYANFFFSFQPKYTIEVHRSLGTVINTLVKMERDGKTPRIRIQIFFGSHGSRSRRIGQISRDERDKQEFTKPSIATSEKCWFSCSTHCSSRSSSSSFFEGQRHALGDRPDGKRENVEDSSGILVSGGGEKMEGILV
ncbi:hypothetical protein DVH24_009084 [Malus domestica]|uniref:Uncharacterized protein n=1 Tax=Malus domestica TaxID=3750 RepID=A0A498JM05_MALDO|nr:hypothetical protein DVH24_009084 [Malus domestica]